MMLFYYGREGGREYSHTPAATCKVRVQAKFLEARSRF